MLIAIEHNTTYHYSSPAAYSVQSLRLTPSVFDGQKLLEWRISSEPHGVMTPTLDGFGNIMHLMTVEGAHENVVITAKGLVQVEDRAGMVRGLVDTVPLRVFLRRTELTTPFPEIRALLEDIPPGDTLPWLHRLMDRIRGQVDYVTGVTDSDTTAIEALRSGHGVCQDHAHIFISAVRAAGLPARYITGYLMMDGFDPEPANHAWAEAWVDNLGWVGFDVANNVCPTDRYVRMAAALDASYAAPVRGSRRGGGQESLAVQVMVQRQDAQQ